MEKLSTQEILDAGLDDWRKLAQALHARYRIADFKAGAAFVAAIAEAAEAAGHHPDVKMTDGVVDVSLCTHEDGVAPFWSVLLTGSPDNKIYDSIFDPTGRVPSMWFQGTSEHETPRQRWHFDVWLAPEVADERIAAAVAAGGSVFDDSHAPSFTVLADPDGNKVCVCTCLERR